MPVKHGILKEELIDQHGVTFNFKQKKKKHEDKSQESVVFLDLCD